MTGKSLTLLGRKSLPTHQEQETTPQTVPYEVWAEERRLGSISQSNANEYYYKYEDELKKNIRLRKQLEDAGIEPEV